ncbi:MAG TPA: hypothetical protein VFP68_13975 [Burkholderiaceae bacterium]|nr:hypothetical protein [Burkholderiaceae bacterium]
MQRKLVTLAAGTALLTIALQSQAQTATEAELAQRVDRLAAGLSALKAQLAELQQQRAAQAQTAVAAM